MKKIILLTTLFASTLFYYIQEETPTSPSTINKEESVTPLVHEKAKEEIKEAIKEYGTYQKLRYYDSDVHVYVSGKGETLAVSKGKEGLEPLKNITVRNEVAKINMGMFDSWFEHGGMYLVDGEYLQPPHKRYIDLHYYKNGKIDIDNYDDTFSKSKLTILKEETHFVVGTTYSLVQDGIKNLQNADLYSHANGRNPRTLFGQRADGRFVMVVVDGRKVSSKGVTADQSANIMLDLNCVEAVNMDGGGSSSIRVNGELKNSPSEGRERHIGSALLIIH